MTLAPWWFLLPLGLSVALPAAAQRRPPDAGDRWAYHRDIRTAVRQDPPPVVHAPAWGSWADAPGAGWPDGGTSANAFPAYSMPARASGHRRPDPNLRRVDVPGEAADSARGWGVGDPWQSPRARHGWRAGWRGAAPGWGGVWWSGWGGDWPAYAVGGDHDGTGDRDGRWHGTFGFEHGWGAGHEAGGTDRDGGRGVIALPAPRGD